jgi:hypothetical protein
LRKDALIVSDGSATLSTVLVYGVGNAPLAALNPGIVTQATTPSTTYDSVVDEDGTAYILLSVLNSVYKYTKAGVLTALPITGLTSPHGIAIDGAGTLYIAQNTFSHQIITYTASGVQGAITLDPPAPYAPCMKSNDGTLEYLYAVAVDGPGNVFALEFVCLQIFELKNNGTYITTAIDPPISDPSDLALDDAGDLFIGGFQINELTSAGAQTQINAMAMGASSGIAVDASGIVYATRYLDGSLYNFGVAELPPSDYAAPTIGLQPGAEETPEGLGLGSDGTVFVGEDIGLDIVNRNAGALAYGEQFSGTASAAQVVQMINIGNRPLTVSDIAFVDAPGYATPTTGTLDCSNGIVLAPSAYCQVGVVLTPTHAGNWNGSLVFTSDSLNNSSTQQTVALTGFVNGVYVTANPSTIAFNPRDVGTSSSAHSVTLTNNGVLYTAEILPPASTNSAFAPSIGTCTAVVPVGGSCELNVTFTPTAGESYSGVISATVESVGGGPNQSVSFKVKGTGEAANTTTTAVTSSLNPSTSGESVTFTATVTAAFGAIPSGTVSFEHLGTVLGTATLSNGVASFTTSSQPVGTEHITAVYSGSATDDGSTSAAVAQVVQKDLTTTILISTPNPSELGQPVTFTATVTAPFGAIPSGTVSFEHLGTVLGAATLSNGVASFSTSSQPVGTEHITAVYSGSATDDGSTSAAVAQVVDP